ncbi:hypothetical protein WA158_000251 [Blastocystis sp. Blastoise]
MVYIFKYVYLFFIANSECVEPTYPCIITRKLSSWPQEERWAIYLGTDITVTGIVVFDGPILVSGSSGTRTYEVCIQNDIEYTLAIWDTYGDGWSSGSTISITVNGNILMTVTLQSDEASAYVKKKFPFLYYSDILFMGTTNPQIDYSWTQFTFIDDLWTPLIFSILPDITTITRYYRYHATLDYNTVHALDISILTKTGFIIYINGQEAARYGLPTGTINSNTQSTITENEHTYKYYSFPTSLFIIPDNRIVIAIEIHSRSSLLNQEDEFRFFNRLLTESGLTYGLYGTVYCSVSGSSTSQNCVKGFDSNLYTKFLFSSKTNTITYSLPDGVKTWFNSYRFVSGTETDTRDPKEWKLYGSEDNGSTWLILDHVYNNIFTQRSAAYVFYLPSNRKSFNTIKLQIVNNNGATSTEFSEFTLMTYNIPLLSPGLQYPTNKLVGINYLDVYLAPISSGIYSYSVTPSLPSGLSLDVNTGIITGSTVVQQNNATYIIRGIDGATGANSYFSLYIAITICQQPSKSYVLLKKINKNNSNDEHVSIYSEDNTQITSFVGTESSIQEYSFYKPAGRWKFVLFDDNNNGWDKGAYLDVFLKYDASTEHRIARMSLLAGTIATYFVNTHLDLAPRSNWKYQQGASSTTTWKTSSFSDINWLPFSYYPLVSVTQNILLLRNTFTVASKTNMVGWELFFKSKAGCVIYVNGNEVYRYNIANGEITTSTVATGGDSSFLWRSVSGPMTTLSNDNSVTIAIALVNIETNSYNIDFDSFFHLLGDSNISQNSSDSIYATNGIASDEHPEYLFDSNPSTRWITPSFNDITQKWITIEFNNKRAIFMNKYCIISNYDSPQYDPSDWTIYGSMDGITWTTITSQSNVSWEERNQRQCFYSLNNNIAYTNYKIRIEKCTLIMPENKYTFSELEFYIKDINSIIIPEFSFTPSNLLAYKGVVVPALLVSSEYFYDFTISPSLPAGITMDTSNGYLNGIPTQLQYPTTYTISAKNIQGISVVTTITFSVIACVFPNSLFKLSFHFTTYANEASWTLKDSNNNLIDSKTTSIDYSTQNFIYCRTSGIYSLTMSDSANDGWGDGTYSIYIEDSITPLHSGGLAYGESPKTITFNVNRLISSSSTVWKYFNQNCQAPSGWNTVPFMDSFWLSGIVTSLPIPYTITQYYRTAFTYSSSNNQYSGITISAKTYAGIIVYLNGQEINRVNMPLGIINYNTLALENMSNSGSYTTISLLMSDIPIDDYNILAIEIHKKDVLPYVNVFSCYVDLIIKDGYRVLDGIPSSDIDIVGNYGIQKLFDNSINTITRSGPRCVGAIFKWTYNNGRREHINRYKVTNGNDCNQRHPSAWRFEGSNDNSTWTLLHYAHNQFFTDYRQTFTYDFYSSVPYNSFRMIVTKCDNTPLDPNYCHNDYVQLSELGFYMTYVPISCISRDNWGPAIEGGFSFQECPLGYNGIQRRLCTNSILGFIQSLCTLDIPSNLFYESFSFIFHKIIPVSLSPTVIGIQLIFIINPNLPNGLSFNSITGEISGIPTIVSPPTNYTITAVNTSGSSSITIVIQVDTYYCSTDSIWPQTEMGLQAILPCDDIINYEGSKSRLCILGYPAIWDNASDTCQLKLPTISYVNNNITGYKNIAIIPIIPTITGGNLNPLTIIPPLPNGLIFNTQTGEISGIPASDDSNSYTITISNARSETTVIISINIITIYCPSDDIWPKTERYTAAYNKCPNGYSGIQTRFCEYLNNTSSTWGLTDTSNCFIYDTNEDPKTNKLFIYIHIKLEGITKVAFNNPSSYESFRTFIVHSLSLYSILSSDVIIISCSTLSSTPSTIIVTLRINVNEVDKNNIKNDLFYYINGTYSSLQNHCTSSNDNNLKDITSISINDDIYIRGDTSPFGFKMFMYIVIILALTISPIVILITIACCYLFKCVKKRLPKKKHLFYSNKKGKTKKQTQNLKI